MLYVLVQFSLLAYMAYSTPWNTITFIPVILIVFSFLLGIWAIASIGLNNLSVFPEPMENSQVRTSGPYKIIRHPMYTAVILFALAMVIIHPLWPMYIAVTALVLDLILKLKFEEKRLLEKFKSYREYKKDTYALIPYIY